MREVKNETCDLKEMVCNLKVETVEKDIIELLREIEKKLIAEYVIKAEGLVIEPLWVEAYYFNKNVFSDCNTHLSEKQKNRFGQLYFHEKGRGGFDICLSDSEDYYLSFLLKRTLINGEFVKQTEIEDVLKKYGKTKEELENVEEVLVKREANQNYKVRYTTRIGLEKPCYKDEKLAAFPLEAITQYDFSSDRKALIPVVRTEMKKYIENPKCTKEYCKSKCKEIFDWCPDCVSKMIQAKKEADKK